MPSWKKLISSGSSAVLSSLTLDSPLAVAQGGTGAATLTSGYALLGNGTSAPQMINSTADSTMLVGNGSTMVAETGGTLRTSIGVDVAGTDNSTDVTLAGSYDYITISGQAITRNQIDLTTDVTGVLPSANLDSDTAHLSTTQTFGGAKTFSSLASFTMDGNTITGVDDSGEFTDDDAHIMTSAAVQDKILGYGYSTTVGDITGVDLTGGTGITIGSETNTTGGAYSSTITNSGVTSNVAGTGISVSGATGAVTITNAGVTSNVAGDLIDVSGATGAVTVNVDLSELTDGTADVVGSADELVYLDAGTQKRKQIDEIKLGQFNNDQSWSATVGTVTSVTAGTGMTQSGTSTVNPTLNVIGGTCITANADDIAVTADSIGDTQLAYNTGQHLTTSSDVNFNTINVNATTTSTTKTTGALIVDGGVGVAENIHAGGDVVAYASSDERLKDNLQVIQDPLDKVGQISGYEFDWNEKSPEWAQERGHDIGVVAQEIQKVHPEIVIERTNGYLGVDYKRIIPLLIESIKELKQEVEDLKKKVN